MRILVDPFTASWLWYAISQPQNGCNLHQGRNEHYLGGRGKILELDSQFLFILWWLPLTTAWPTTDIWGRSIGVDWAAGITVKQLANKSTKKQFVGPKNFTRPVIPSGHNKLMKLVNKSYKLKPGTGNNCYPVQHIQPCLQSYCYGNSLVPHCILVKYHWKSLLSEQSLQFSYQLIFITFFLVAGTSRKHRKGHKRVQRVTWPVGEILHQI